MEQPNPRPNPMYPGELTHENIAALFQGAADFVTRELYCAGFVLHTYAIDGLTSGGSASEYVFKPIAERLQGDTMGVLYDNALHGLVYNSVAKPCKDLQDAVFFLVNGFCVVLFEGVGAIAYEVKTPEKRSISPPEVENTVKGPKDAFVETFRSNTSLIRRHLRTPKLRIYETKVGRQSLTNVAVVWGGGVTHGELVGRKKNRLSPIGI